MPQAPDTSSPKIPLPYSIQSQAIPNDAAVEKKVCFALLHAAGYLPIFRGLGPLSTTDEHYNLRVLFYRRQAVQTCAPILNRTDPTRTSVLLTGECVLE